jgi:hypothetical protein
VKRLVWVDARGDHIIVASNWTSEGRYPLFYQGDWAERAGEPVSDEALGALAREAFRNCRVGILVADLGNDPAGDSRVAALLKLGGARSQTAYARTTRHVSLKWDDTARTITLASYQSDTRGGFTGIRDAEAVVKDSVGDAELGQAVRQAIARSRSLI